MYLHDFEDMRRANAGISDYLRFFNQERYHQALGYRTPMAVYRESIASQRRLVA